MCGLAHSIFVTTPLRVTGLLMSNSAAKEWCAASGRASRSGRTAPINMRFMVIIGRNRQSGAPYGDHCPPAPRPAQPQNQLSWPTLVPSHPAAAAVLGIQRQLLEEGIAAQDDAGADDHRRQRIFDNLNRELGLLLAPAIEVAAQG